MTPDKLAKPSTSKSKVIKYYTHNLHLCNYLVKKNSNGALGTEEVQATPGPPATSRASPWPLDKDKLESWFDFVHKRTSTHNLFCWSTSVEDVAQYDAKVKNDKSNNKA